jgi:arginyl-tRNA synthetase
MQSIKTQLLQSLDQVLNELGPSLSSDLTKGLSPDECQSLIQGHARLEEPKQASLGDWAITTALGLAKPLRMNPLVLGEHLKAALEKQTVFVRWVERMDLLKPGFINLWLKPEAKQQVVYEILQSGENYGRVLGTQDHPPVLVEFVSANPTGPLHLGHARQAALGDAICRLLAHQGRRVYREFYYNDAGVQIHALTRSVQARAKGLRPGDAQWPEQAYNGDYIEDIAQDFLAQGGVTVEGHTVRATGDPDDEESLRAFAVAYLRQEQDRDLAAFGVHFDRYYLESSLYTDGRVSKLVERLQSLGACYEKEGALWLKTTDYGDDKDRVMRKSDGTYTYFVPDVAYHITKWERGFQQAINIQGSDHHGTIARVRAGLQAAQIGIPSQYPTYVLHTMIRVVRGGEEVKISKRAGSYITLKDLIDWTSADAVRFFLLSRKPDTEYTFDVDLALAQNNQNPVYYVQYAHARICSVLSAWGGDVQALEKANLRSLIHPAASRLMLYLARYPDTLAQAAESLAPHDLVFYLRELASEYHAYYDAERILVDDETLTRARLALAAATAQVLRHGLGLLGVSAPSQMNRQDKPEMKEGI